tara:strand:- start:1382 stop:1564 length:183 start_codon:yes stop_codon:yes gene_type:complete
LYSGSEIIHSNNATLAFVKYIKPAKTGLLLLSTTTPVSGKKSLAGAVHSGQAFHHSRNKS